MRAVLQTQDDGVAIAAPQIGVPLRIFIVSGKALDLQNKKKRTEGAATIPSPDMVCINPVITKLSRTKRWMAEGCLSVRYLYGKIHRSTHATVAHTMNTAPLSRAVDQVCWLKFFNMKQTTSMEYYS